MKAFATVISGLLMAAPAPAQSGAAADRAPNGSAEPAGNAASAERENGDRRICRRVETNTGSRVPFRTLCLTERQWENYRREN